MDIRRHISQTSLTIENFVGMIHLQLFERKGNIEHIVL